jgi:hypothetical protein
LYNLGVQDEESWIPSLVKYKIVAMSGSWYTVDPDVAVSVDGEILKFQKKELKQLLANDKTLETKLFAALSKKVHTTLMLPGDDLVVADLDGFEV